MFADGFDAPKRAPRAAKSFAANQAQGVTQTPGPGEDGKMTVRVYTGAIKTLWPLDLQARAFIEIRVKPLDLGIGPENLQAELDRAMQEKMKDDQNTYGADMKAAGYSTLEEWARATGYYGSPEHRAWAEAASARTGGQIPADWWMQFDPFGGTAGNGPHVLPAGRYPDIGSRIAMAHDTDWNLGRYFGVGPLSALRGAPNPEKLGDYGLFPGQGVDMYTNGHPDWDVTYGDEVLPYGTEPVQVA
jgi:hypothetical protein